MFIPIAGVFGLDLQLNINDGSLYYTAVIGEPQVALHRVAYIFLRDSLNNYLLSSGNELPLSEIPRGAYNWVPPPAPPEVDLHDASSIYDGSDGPEYIDWEGRYLDRAD